MTNAYKKYSVIFFLLIITTAAVVEVVTRRHIRRAIDRTLLYNYRASKSILRKNASILEGIKRADTLTTGTLSLEALDGYGNHLRYDRESKIYYSLGPDESDQNGVIIFDPSNGLSSSGDILYILR